MALLYRFIGLYDVTNMVITMAVAFWGELFTKFLL
jgi:hypothetical protein